MLYFKSLLFFFSIASQKSKNTLQIISKWTRFFLHNESSLFSFVEDNSFGNHRDGYQDHFVRHKKLSRVVWKVSHGGPNYYNIQPFVRKQKIPTLKGADLPTENINWQSFHYLYEFCCSKHQNQKKNTIAKLELHFYSEPKSLSI